MKRAINYLRRLDERFQEWRLGIDTDEWHAVIDPDHPDRRGYSPTKYRDWRIIRRHIFVNGESAFIDYGAGLGRVTILAALLPFSRVIGVEVSPHLVRRAHDNIRNVRGLLRTRIEMVIADASTFEIPKDASTLFFHNPFAGSILSSVLENARRSHCSHPRLLQIICNVPAQSAFENEITSVKCLKLKEDFLLSDRRKCLIFSLG
jgi:SAM-dependent methyltransferase